MVGNCFLIVTIYFHCFGNYTISKFLILLRVRAKQLLQGGAMKETLAPRDLLQFFDPLRYVGELFYKPIITQKYLAFKVIPDRVTIYPVFYELLVFPPGLRFFSELLQYPIRC